MTEDILQAIKKKAEEKYRPNIFHGTVSGADLNEPCRKGYTSGQVDAIELMMEFDKWKIENDWEWSVSKRSKGEDAIWYVPAGDGKYYTTEQLLSEYIKQLNNG